MNAQIIERDGRPEWAVIPYEDYRELLGLAEDMADIRAADEARAAIEAGEETFPLDLVERLCKAENPLRVWREYRGMTPGELAARVGIEEPTLVAFERDDARIPDEVAARLVSVLDIELDDLAPQTADAYPTMVPWKNGRGDQSAIPPDPDAANSSSAVASTWSTVCSRIQSYRPSQVGRR